MPLARLPFRFDPEEDRALAERCLAGDARAWEALVRRHERLVYAVARSWRLSDEDLGDVFQEVFAALVKGLPRMRDTRTLVRWLASTTERVARATALRARRVQALMPATAPEVLDGVMADAGEVGLSLERLESQALVRAALASLGERCRDLLAALYYEDPTPAYADLAARMGLPIGSLGPTRARCFQKMREALAGLNAEQGRGINPPVVPTSEPGGPAREPRRAAPGPTGPDHGRMGDRP